MQDQSGRPDQPPRETRREQATQGGPAPRTHDQTTGGEVQSGGEQPRMHQQQASQAPMPAAGLDASQGSRAGSVLGSQSPRTGMADGEPHGSSQGLAGAQGSGGGAERGPPGSIGGGPDLER